MTNPVVIDTTPGTGYLDLTREFDAPVRTVFRAHADPELFVQDSAVVFGNVTALPADEAVDAADTAVPPVV